MEYWDKRKSRMGETRTAVHAHPSHISHVSRPIGPSMPPSNRRRRSRHTKKTDNGDTMSDDGTGKSKREKKSLRVKKKRRQEITNTDEVHLHRKSSAHSLGEHPFISQCLGPKNENGKHERFGGWPDILQQFNEIKSYIPEKFTFENFEKNREKNKHRDVVCLDTTRVVLTLNVPPEGDYIHANKIQMPGCDRPFIATNIPEQDTLEDFWRMVYETQATVVVVLQPIEDEHIAIEGGKRPPMNLPKDLFFPVEAGAYQNVGKMFVSNKKAETTENDYTAFIEVLPDGCSNSVLAKFIYTNHWPRTMNFVKRRAALAITRNVEKSDKGPAIVTCPSGIGPSSSLILLAAAIARLNRGLDIRVPAMLKELRDQRASACQTFDQFVMVYVLTLEYMRCKETQYEPLARECLEAYFDFDKNFRHKF